MVNAELLSTLTIPDPFEVDDAQVVVDSLTYAGGNDLVVRMTVVRAGMTVYDTSEDFIFRNPPILVPDGDTRIVEHPRQGPIEEPTYEADPATALVRMITDTLRICLRPS